MAAKSVVVQAGFAMPWPSDMVGFIISGNGWLDTLVILVALFILLDVVLVAVVSGQVRKLYRTLHPQESAEAEPEKATWWHLFDRSRGEPDQLVPNHEYDGIREYDNNPPAWFNWLFWLSIFWGILYFSYYHVFDLGMLQEEEYALEMELAEATYATLETERKIDLEKVEPYVEADKIALGQEVYIANCAACHGPEAGGGTGPNLTDEYWIHGGSFPAITGTIIYGVPEKGMLAWEERLKSKEILAVASYIESVRNTNVEGGKEPQGELYKGEYAGDSGYEADEDPDVVITDEALGGEVDTL